MAATAVPHDPAPITATLVGIPFTVSAAVEAVPGRTPYTRLRGRAFGTGRPACPREGVLGGQAPPGTTPGRGRARGGGPVDGRERPPRRATDAGRRGVRRRRSGGLGHRARRAGHPCSRSRPERRGGRRRGASRRPWCVAGDRRPFRSAAGVVL